MNSNRKTIVASVMAVCLLAAVSAFAGDNTKAKGMIIARTGETLVLSGPDGKTTVVLDDNTKVQKPIGLGVRKKQVSAAVLIPGLKVSVDGTTDEQNRLVAKSITFSSTDLETAEMIQAGLHPTAEQVAANVTQLAAQKQDISTNQGNISANKQGIAANEQATAANKENIDKNNKDIEENTKRFSELGDYELKGEGTANFKVGSAKIAPEDLARLDKLAQNAKSWTGYIIEVKGFADSTGGASMNTRLSKERAEAVVNYLVQHGVPIRHITAPGAYGETNEVASNETASGRAENRRVEVKVLINKGIAGS
jgi:outer membrane protein OmpA-like peptidoglycan-associated protein